MDNSHKFLMTRRQALMAMGGGVAALAGCGSDGPTGPGDSTTGRLTARPTSGRATLPTGISTLPLTLGLDGLLFVPTSYNAATPAPVALLLHGAGRDASELMTPVSSYAQSRGLVLISLSAAAGTWDAINGDFGPDVKHIDIALAWLFDRCNVDATRIGVMGFSDGATYAIALARINGDLFRRATIYSPGYLIGASSVGKPEFFITHGTSDQVLSVNTTRNVIVPSLRAAGYSVEYHEWDGGHGVPAALLEDSVTWFVRPS